MQNTVKELVENFLDNEKELELYNDNKRNIFMNLITNTIFKIDYFSTLEKYIDLHEYSFVRLLLKIYPIGNFYNDKELNKMQNEIFENIDLIAVNLSNIDEEVDLLIKLVYFPTEYIDFSSYYTWSLIDSFPEIYKIHIMSNNDIIDKLDKLDKNVDLYNSIIKYVRLWNC